jgi:DNA-binding NtrC family response regulator
LKNEARMKVLIVDDDGLSLEALSRSLILFGHTVISYNNPQDAIAWYLKNNRVDIIITDYSMPEINGIELIKRIKKIDNRVPVLVISGLGRYEREENQIRENSDYFIVKPIEIKKLLGVLEKIEEHIESVED